MNDPAEAGPGACAQRRKRLEGRHSVGFGACRIGLGLRRFPLGDAVVRSQIAIRRCNSPTIGRGDRRLAIGCDRIGDVGGRDCGQRLPFGDRLTESDKDSRYRTGERRDDRCRLVIVVIDRAWRLDPLAVSDRGDRVELDMAQLVLRQLDVRDDIGRRIVSIGRRRARGNEGERQNGDRCPTEHWLRSPDRHGATNRRPRPGTRLPCR